YHWPGNVRELRNLVERMVALCEGPVVGPENLPPALLAAPAVPPLNSTERATLTLSESRDEVEMGRINEALRKHRNNRQRVAAELGISRMGLYKKLHKYGLMHSVGNGG